jgi:hypothetical protein
MMKPVLIPAIHLWASWQREATLTVIRAALLPMAAFASLARSAEVARCQRTDYIEGRPSAWQAGGGFTSISDFQTAQQECSSSGEAATQGESPNGHLRTQTEMRKALEEGSEALRDAAAAFVTASKLVSAEFNRSADRHIAACDQACEALIKATFASSERFAAAAHQATESLREAVVGLSEASKELSLAAREAGEALTKGAATDEIRQAGKKSGKAAALGSDGSQKKKSAEASGSSRESNRERRKSARASERRAG